MKIIHPILGSYSLKSPIELGCFLINLSDHQKLKDLYWYRLIEDLGLVDCLCLELDLRAFLDRMFFRKRKLLVLLMVYVDINQSTSIVISCQDTNKKLNLKDVNNILDLNLSEDLILEYNKDIYSNCFERG